MPDTNHDGPVPTTTLGALKGTWAFEVRCSRCRHQVKLAIEVVVQRAGADTRLYEIVDRFRCDRLTGSNRSEKCRGRPSRVVLRKFNVYGKSVTPQQTIVIYDSTGG